MEKSSGPEVKARQKIPKIQNAVGTRPTGQTTFVGRTGRTGRTGGLSEARQPTDLANRR